MRRLYRSEDDKVLAGVIGGLGEYMDIDPTILRLAYVLIAVATGVFPAIAGYFIALIIVPKAPSTVHMNYTEKKSEPEVNKEEPKPEEKEEVIEL